MQRTARMTLERAISRDFFTQLSIFTQRNILLENHIFLAIGMNFNHV